METAELVAQEIKTMSTTLDSIKKSADQSGIDAKSAVQLAEAMQTKLNEMKFATPEDIMSIKTEFQAQFDELAANKKDGKKEEVKTLDVAMYDALKEFFPNEGSGVPSQSKLQDVMKGKAAKHRIELPEVKVMTLPGNLSGDPVATYSNRQAIFPSQKINFRDLMPTTQTDTGLYVFFREDTGETNNINFQVEGSIKPENNYSLSEVKIVQQYLAGYTRFSKQMLNSLPFLSQVLPRMLQRDFFKVENANFYNTVAIAASGSTTTDATDTVEKVIDYVANQRSANFNPSYAIVSPAARASLVKSTYNKGYYPGAGAVVYNGSTLTIDEVPIISASWATNGKILIIDQDYLERVQVSGLAIELSYEDQDNFVKNLVTARIEAQEEINIMLSQSAIYANL